MSLPDHQRLSSTATPVPPRMIFFDVDGTLRPLHGAITPQILGMLRELQESGILVAIATGRSPAMLPDFGDFEFDAYLTFNGSLNYAGHPRRGAVISASPLPARSVGRLMDNAARLGLPVVAATDAHMIANGADENLIEYFALGGLSFQPDPDFAAKVAAQDIYQVMVGATAAQYEALLAGADGLGITAWWPRAVDVIPAGSGKATAVEQVRGHFGVDLAACWAFGDGANDMDMLAHVGWGVAMGNAATPVQDIADAVCGDVAAGGVPAYLRATGVLGSKRPG